MRTEVSVSLYVAVLCLAFAGPALPRAAASSPSAASAAEDAALASGSAIAARMVPARAALISDINSAKVKTGSKIQIRLADKVELKDGKELPSGTLLIGAITADRMQSTGTSRLAFNFTQAHLKDGTTVPIKATIVDVAPPQTMTDFGYNVAPGNQVPNHWTASTLQVDVVNALSGIDMHSKINGQNSGVFISNKKHDMKFSAGTEFALALGTAS